MKGYTRLTVGPQWPNHIHRHPAYDVPNDDRSNCSCGSKVAFAMDTTHVLWCINFRFGWVLQRGCWYFNALAFFHGFRFSQKSVSNNLEAITTRQELASLCMGQCGVIYFWGWFLWSLIINFPVIYSGCTDLEVWRLQGSVCAHARLWKGKKYIPETGNYHSTKISPPPRM